MKYSKTTLRELTAKYRSVLKKCALFNATMLLSLMIAGSASAANVQWDGKSALEIASGDTWKSSTTQTVEGTLTGSGTVSAAPSKVSGSTKYEDTTLTIKSDISGFDGTFYAKAMGSPAGRPTVVFETRNNSGMKLSGNGTFIFDGTGEAKFSATEGEKSGVMRIILNDNALSKSSTTSGSVTIYLGKSGEVEGGRNVSLTGYNLASASIVANGLANTITGDLTVDVSDSKFNGITALGNNTTLIGDINLNLGENTVVKKVVGHQGGGDTSSSTNTTVTGNINIVGTGVQADAIYGQQFSAEGEVKSGIDGNINIDLTDSVVGNLRGVNFNAGDYINWNRDYYNQAEAINIKIEDTAVLSELLSVGSYTSAGNVKIDVLGNSSVGYDAEGNVTSGDGWIIAGAQKPGARIASTEVNLNTKGMINIAGDVNVGSREDKRDGKDADVGSVTGNATLNMLGGGTINVGGTLRAYNVAGKTTLNINDVTANVGNIANEFQTITLNENAKLNVAGTLEMAEGSTINMTLIDTNAYSQITAGAIDANGANLKFAVAKEGVYNLVTTDEVLSDFTWNLENTIYDLEQKDGTITATVKSGEAMSESLGANQQSGSIVSGLLTDTSSNEVASQILVNIQSAGLTGGSLDGALETLAPTSAPVTMSVASDVTGRISSMVGAQIGGAGTGRSGGDTEVDVDVWAKGLYSKAKQDASYSSAGFRGYTQGVAMGIDAVIDNTYTIGAGYAYAQTDVKAEGRKTEVDGHNFFVYGEYQPSEWYVRGIATYGMSDYEEHKDVVGVRVDADYDVDVYGAEVMTGYDFASGITPSVGLRYLHITQDSYKDTAGQSVKTDDTDLLTAVASMKYAYDMTVDNTVFTPEIHAGVTYDVISDNTEATVALGGASYTAEGKRLPRFGVEAGVGMAMRVADRVELNVGYDISVRRDYTAHTGTAKLEVTF